MSWFYLDRDATATGPVSSSFILEKYHWKNGEIVEGTHVWNKDLVPNWSELSINYSILADDAISNMQNGQISKHLLQFMLNPYTIYIQNIKHRNKAISPMGKAKVEIEYKGYLASADNPNASALLPFIQNREIIQLGMKKNAYGLEMALYNMSVGDQSHVYIPWRLAYGERGAGNLIPAKTDILFDLKIHKIKEQGAKWTVVKFDKWRKMKQKWNLQKQNTNTLYIKSEYEKIKYVAESQAVSKPSVEPKANPKPIIKTQKINKYPSNQISVSLGEWLLKQQISDVLLTKLSDGGISSWDDFYAINDNVDAKVVELGLNMMHKMKLQALLRNLPNRNGVSDMDEKEAIERKPGAVRTMVPPPAPLDAAVVVPESMSAPNPKKKQPVILFVSKKKTVPIKKVETVDSALRDNLDLLHKQLDEFERKFTEKEILNMFNESKGSIFVEKEIDSLELKMKSTMNNLQRMRKQIVKLKMSGFDTSNYENWSIAEMIQWIVSLDDGKFAKYENTIRAGFIENAINGQYLITMGSLDIKEICGINNWKDRKDLAAHFSTLKK